jgi:flagellar basal body rod protein FlgG
MTIRYLALLAVCIAIALLSLPRTLGPIVTKTGRDLDIMIVGRGSFCLLDEGAAEPRYTRFGRLQIDADGQLVVDADGAEWLIDPPIQIPGDWERIAVLPDGRVQTLEAGSWSDAGQLQLAVFMKTPPFDDDLAANLQLDIADPPTMYMPSNVAGVIQQGWLEERPSILKDLGMHLLLAILAAGVLWRCTNSRVQNSIG